MADRVGRAGISVARAGRQDMADRMGRAGISVAGWLGWQDMADRVGRAGISVARAGRQDMADRGGVVHGKRLLENHQQSITK